MERISRKLERILLTGSGCPGWYSTYLALKDRFDVLGCDMLSYTVGERLAEHQFQVPAGNSPEYINSIQQIVQLHNIAAVIPLTDPELIPLSRAELGCKVMVSVTSELEKILDKSTLYTEHTKVAPKFVYCKSSQDAIDFIDGESCFIKLTTAHGSRGTKKLVRTSEWLKGFSTLKPEVFGMTFPLGHLDAISSQLIAVETLPGAEYSIDCVFGSDSQLVFYGVRERETIQNGICSVAKFIVDSDKEFLSFIHEVNRSIKMRYNINIQAKRDKEGSLKLLEINPRISGSLGAFYSIGYNLAEMGLDILLKNSRGDQAITPAGYLLPRVFRTSHFVGGG